MIYTTVDFETFYDSASGYTLKKLTTEEYIRSPYFQIIGVAIAEGDAPAVWVDNHNDAAIKYIRSLDWSNRVAIGHNMSEFDGFILTERCGVAPAVYQCTLALARALHGSKVSNSLDSLAQMYGVGTKGHEVHNADGMRLQNFTAAELSKYGEYCKNDVDLCWRLYKKFRQKIPSTELFKQHLLTRMFAEPRLCVDGDLAERLLAHMIASKQALFDAVGMDRKQLRSGEALAAAFRKLGVEPPTKLSPKQKNADGTPAVVYAFAKTDRGMEALLDYADDPDDDVNIAVQTLAAAKIGASSTNAESRIGRFCAISKRGMLPAPLAYGKTHTLRAAGGGKINLQNQNRTADVQPDTPSGTLVLTPSGPGTLHKISPDKRKLAVVVDGKGVVCGINECHKVGTRDLIVAPPGKVLVVVDSSTIELRVGHLLAGQLDTIAKIRSGVDLYCDFASDLYAKPINKKEHPKERQHGKVAMLQLQYQSGAGSFQRASRVMAKLMLSDDEAQKTVDVYRSKHAKIRQFWYRCHDAIEAMYAGEEMYIDQWGLCKTERNAIVLPNGMRMHYTNLRQRMIEGQSRPQWEYDCKETREVKRVYGGAIFENLCQALAGLVVFEQLIAIERRWAKPGCGVALMVHDEGVVVVDEEDGPECLEFMLQAMRTPPKWWPDLPLGAEGDIGKRYGDCK